MAHPETTSRYQKQLTESIQNFGVAWIDRLQYFRSICKAHLEIVSQDDYKFLALSRLLFRASNSANRTDTEQLELAPWADLRALRSGPIWPEPGPPGGNSGSKADSEKVEEPGIDCFLSMLDLKMEAWVPLLSQHDHQKWSKM